MENEEINVKKASKHIKKALKALGYREKEIIKILSIDSTMTGTRGVYDFRIIFKAKNVDDARTGKIMEDDK